MCRLPIILYGAIHNTTSGNIRQIKMVQPKFLSFAGFTSVFNIPLMTIAPFLTHLTLSHLRNEDTRRDWNYLTGSYLGKLIHHSFLIYLTLKSLNVPFDTPFFSMSLHVPLIIKSTNLLQDFYQMPMLMLPNLV